MRHERCMKITFDYVSKCVMKNTKMQVFFFDKYNLSLLLKCFYRSFNVNHLAQIMGVYLNSYKLRWEQRRQQAGKFAKASFDLILEPNFLDGIHYFVLFKFKKNIFFADLHPYYTESSMSLATAWRKTARKMLFRHFLVIKVKDSHSNFLQANNSNFLFHYI